MKPWIVIAGVLSLFIVLGSFVSTFSTQVEYYYPDPLAHIEGATPSYIERWEIY